MYFHHADGALAARQPLLINRALQAEGFNRCREPFWLIPLWAVPGPVKANKPMRALQPICEPLNQTAWQMTVILAADEIYRRLEGGLPTEIDLLQLCIQASAGLSHPLGMVEQTRPVVVGH